MEASSSRSKRKRDRGKSSKKQRAPESGGIGKFSGKAGDKREAGGGIPQPNPNMNSGYDFPPRRFKKGNLPPHGRINDYFNLELLQNITKYLYGSQEYEWLMNSPFKGIMDLPTAMCAISPKLVHQLLCRTLVVENKHEVWFVFGGKPIRYSLSEFARLTGLNCDRYPSSEEYEVNEEVDKKDTYWRELIGPQSAIKVKDINRILHMDMVKKVGPRMSGERRLKLCLILLVEGVLIPESLSPNVTKKHVEMLRDLDVYANYPWGRKAFEASLQMITIGAKIKSEGEIIERLSQSHYSGYGFVLGFQLLALNCVPLLDEIIKRRPEDSTFGDPNFTGLSKAKPFHNKNIEDAEKNPQLDVVSILDFGYDVDEEWDLTWPEDVEDYRVDNLVRCIREGYNFKDDDFQGGVVPIVESSSEVEEVRKPKKQRKRAARPPPVPSSPKTQVPEGTPRRMTRSYTKAKGKAPETGESSKVEGEGDLEPDELYEAVRGVFSRLESRVNQEIKHAEVEALKLMVRGVAVKEEIIHKMVKEFMERDGMGSGPRFRKVDTEIPDGGSDKDVCNEPDIEDVTDKDKDAGDEKEPAMETEPARENEATREEAAREKEASREKEVADERIRATLEDLATGEKEKSREGNQEETAVQMDISSGEDVRKGPGKKIEEVDDESSSEEFESSTDDEVEEIKHPGPTQPGTVNPASSSLTPARPSEATPVKPPNPVSVSSKDATVSSPLKETVASPVKSKTSVVTEVETSAVKASSGQTSVQTNVDQTSTETQERGQSSPANKDVRKTDNVSIPVNEGIAIPESVEGQVGGVVSEGTGNVDQLGTKESAVASSMLEVEEKGDGDPKESEEESDGDGQEGNEDESESEEGDSEEDDEVPTPVPQEKTVVDVPSGGRGKRLKFKSAKIRTPESEKRKDVVPEEEGYDPLGFVSGPKKKAFLAKIKQYKTEEVDVNGYGQKEIFFQRIYRPKNYVENDHMDTMLSLIWDRQGDVFLERRVAIMDSFFMQYLKTEYEKFKSMNRGGGTVPWSRTLRNHVRGASPNRYGSLRWLVDVDVVYTPLNVGGNHWVAVVINLVEGTVTVLDCFASITTEAKMKTYMKPYLEALPILLRDLNTSGKSFPQKFTYAGRPEVLQNVRGGDCGPLTVKFIEMDAQGKALDEVTEDIIDELRLKYAVDIFEEYVEPVFSR